CVVTVHVFVSSERLLPASALFPYTTLFRSDRRRPARTAESGGWRADGLPACRRRGRCGRVRKRRTRDIRSWKSANQGAYACLGRSEEHTSELQSRENLVCRLLLEKKKIQII